MRLSRSTSSGRLSNLPIWGGRLRNRVWNSLYRAIRQRNQSNGSSLNFVAIKTVGPHASQAGAPSIRGFLHASCPSCLCAAVNATTSHLASSRKATLKLWKSRLP